MQYYEIKYPRMVKLIGESTIVDVLGQPAPISKPELETLYKPVPDDNILTKLVSHMYMADCREYQDAISLYYAGKMPSTFLLFAALAITGFLLLIARDRDKEETSRRLLRLAFCLLIARGQSGNQLIMEDTRAIWESTPDTESFETRH